MSNIGLSDLFKGVAIKKLSEVEVDTRVSNQHEFNGVSSLKSIFGDERMTTQASFFYFADDELKREKAEGNITWYNARENHPSRTEFRLYFQSSVVTERASPGDLLLILRKLDGAIFVIIADAGSTYEAQLQWMFGYQQTDQFKTDVYGKNHQRSSLPSKIILAELGIDIDKNDDKLLEDIIRNYGNQFPTTNEFSMYARSKLEELDCSRNPDEAIVSLYEMELKLFSLYEKYLVELRMKKGFNSPDDLLGYSLKILNRRKSRAGHALEHHLEAIFKEHKLSYSRGGKTELRIKPDFLFPGVREYHSPEYPSSMLDMLGVKTTCKDRWRQVLSEADRITEKHLFTLEPAISLNQIREMGRNRVKLVIPKEIHSTFPGDTVYKLYSLQEFIKYIKIKQSN